VHSAAGRDDGRAEHQRGDRHRGRGRDRDAADHRPLDRALIELDGAEKKGRLGANAILGLSMAAARARAAEYQRPVRP